MSAALSPPRARAHPRAVLGVWAWQAAVAVVAAWPAAALVRAVYGNDPRGDGPLWEAGGAELLDFLLRNAAGVTATASGAFVVALAATMTGLIPLAALMASLGRPRADAALPHALRISFRVLPTFAKCAVVVLAAQGATLGVGVFLGALAEGWSRAKLGEAPAETLEVALVLPFAAAALALGVAHDLARSLVVTRGVGALEGLAKGLRLLGEAPAHLGWAWAWRALAGLVPVGAAALLSVRAETLPFILLALVHQAAVLSRVALRASWLARALEAVPSWENLGAASQTAESDR